MHSKKIIDYFILKLAKYHTPTVIIISALIMLVAFSFLFKFFFLPMGYIYRIYNSSAGLNNYVILEEQAINEAYKGIEKKINRKKIPVDDIEFPY